MRSIVTACALAAATALLAACGGSSPAAAPAAPATAAPGAAEPGSAAVRSRDAAATAAAVPGPVATVASAVDPLSSAVVCKHFAANPMCAPLPLVPSVSPQSAVWALANFQPGHVGIAGMNTANGSNQSDENDGSEPLEEVAASTPRTKVVVSCDRASWGPAFCANHGMQGTTLAVPSDMLPSGNADHHFSYDDPAANGEYDFWSATKPGAAGSTLHVGGAGFCAWGGDGTGCSFSTATDIATSLGGIDAASLKAAEGDPHGTLGYAISVSALCADASWVYPATYSDGWNTDATPACYAFTTSGGRPPEGGRWFLNKSDAEIDATSNAPYVKAILRTLDRQHFGGTITDTNWSGAPGFSVAYHRGDYGFAAREAGVSAAPDTNVPITLDGIDLLTDVEFCTNGTC